MALSSNRQGHRPFTAAMPGSNPAGVTIRPLRLTGQDGSLSSCKCGFESCRGHHEYGGVPERSKRRRPESVCAAAMPPVGSSPTPVAIRQRTQEAEETGSENREAG